MKQLNRIYHPYWKWEEIKYNMWGSVKNKNWYFKKAISFMSNYRIFGLFMKKVINNWKYSCEHNLTNYTQNRKAWLGQAACALAFRCPENIVRIAWNCLTETQRILANNQADINIRYWESCQKLN